MKCCVECFRDLEVRDRVSSLQTVGNCDICPNHRGVAVMELNDDSLSSTNLRYEFEALASIYSVSKVGQRGLPLAERLRTDFGIFSDDVSAAGVNQILAVILSEYLKTTGLDLNRPLAFGKEHDELFLATSSITHGLTWTDFDQSIKFKSRFHTNIINDELLGDILQPTLRTIPKNSVFYRARIVNHNAKPTFTRKDIMTPPAKMVGAGRFNPAGIGFLYLGSDLNTNFAEIKAALANEVIYAKFTLKRAINVFDLSRIAHISPFSQVDDATLLVNRPVLAEIDESLRGRSRPIRSEVDYLSSEYISEVARTTPIGQGTADGIIYNSTIHSEAENLVLFDESSVRLTGQVRKATITDIQLQHADVG